MALSFRQIGGGPGGFKIFIRFVFNIYPLKIFQCGEALSLTEVVRTGPVGANFTSIPPIQEIKVRTSRDSA